MKSRWKRSLGMTLFAAAALAVPGLAVIVLWDWLVPALFGFLTIAFWQAMGLLLLSRILFGRSWAPGRMGRQRKTGEHGEQGVVNV